MNATWLYIATAESCGQWERQWPDQWKSRHPHNQFPITPEKAAKLVTLFGELETDEDAEIVSGILVLGRFQLHYSNCKEAKSITIYPV